MFRWINRVIVKAPIFLHPKIIIFFIREGCVSPDTLSHKLMNGNNDLGSHQLLTHFISALGKNKFSKSFFLKAKQTNILS